MISLRSAASRPSTSVDDWQATRQQTGLATRLIGDDERDAENPEVGRPTAPNQHELFVSCAPEIALQQQFELRRPLFLAVHDLGTQASRKLLVALAAAGRRPLQRLSIRRQGYGNVLATLEFVELPTGDGGVLRLYATAAEADTAARHGLARVLLGFSQLAAVMVGDLPGHAIGSMLAPIREAMLEGPWPNRELLLLPLSAGATLSTRAAELARGTPVEVRATPQVVRPADAWGYLNGAWARLRERSSADGRALPALSGGAAAGTGAPPDAAAPARVERRARPREPLRAVAGNTGASRAEDAVLERYVEALALLPGVLGCCIFDLDPARPAVRQGSGRAPAELAAQGRALLEAIGTSGRALGAGDRCAEAAITLGARHLLLRTLPHRPGLALHVVLDKASANLTLARLQIQRLDALLEPPAGR